MREWIAETAFYVYESMYPVLGISFLAVFFVFIPLGLFDRTRSFAAGALYLISYIFGFAIWIYSAGVAFGLFGWIWLIIGLVLAGLGVIAVAFFGTLFNGYFSLAFGILLSALIPVFLRYVANNLAEKEETRRRQAL